MSKQKLDNNYYNFIMSVQKKMAEYGYIIFCESNYLEVYDEKLKEVILKWAELRSLLKFLIYDFNSLEKEGEETFILTEIDDYKFNQIKEEYMIRHNINIIPYTSMSNYKPIIQTKVEQITVIQGGINLPSGNQPYQVLGTNAANEQVWMNIEDFIITFNDL